MGYVPCSECRVLATVTTVKPRTVTVAVLYSRSMTVKEGEEAKVQSTIICEGKAIIMSK